MKNLLITLIFYCICPNMSAQAKNFFCNNYDFDSANCYLRLMSLPVKTKKSDLKYDLKIKLKEIRIIQTCEIDGKEDVHGNQIVFKAISTLNNENRDLLTHPRFLWDVQRSNKISRRPGQKIEMNDRTIEITNMTLDEIINLQIWFGGKIYDYERLYSMEYNCLECSEPQQYPLMRVFNINNSNTRINEINALLPNNTYRLLTVGDDKILELNYEEGFAGCISKIRVIYNLYVKAH